MTTQKNDTVMIGVDRKLRDALKAKCAAAGKQIKSTVEALIEKFLKEEKNMFYRKNADGNAVVFHASGEAVTRIDANVYPVGVSVSAKYEHPEGIVLTLGDAEKIGIKPE